MTSRTVRSVQGLASRGVLRRRWSAAGTLHEGGVTTSISMARRTALHHGLFLDGLIEGLCSSSLGPKLGLPRRVAGGRSFDAARGEKGAVSPRGVVAFSPRAVSSRGVLSRALMDSGTAFFGGVMCST